MPGRAQLVTWESFPGRWQLTSASPDADLIGVVEEYWEVEGELAPFRQKVLPNGCTEIMVNLGPVHRTLSRGEHLVWDRAWFSGLHERSIEIESDEGTHLVSARLTPIGAWSLFGVAAPRAANSVVDLDAFIGDDAREMRQRLLTAAGPAQRFEMLEEFIRKRLTTRVQPSDFVTAAVEAIDAAHGNIRVSSLYESLTVSRKHLTMRFAHEIGMPLKAYAQIRRFVWTLAQLRESESLDWASLAAAAGYSDQSHMVRDFRRIADASPSVFLRTRSPDTTATLESPR